MPNTHTLPGYMPNERLKSLVDYLSVAKTLCEIDVESNTNRKEVAK